MSGGECVAIVDLLYSPTARHVQKCICLFVPDHLNYAGIDYCIPADNGGVFMKWVNLCVYILIGGLCFVKEWHLCADVVMIVYVCSSYMSDYV